MFCLEESKIQLKNTIQLLEQIIVNLTYFSNCTSIINQQIEEVFDLLLKNKMIILTDNCGNTVKKVKECSPVYGYGLLGYKSGYLLTISHRVILTKNKQPINQLISPNVECPESFSESICELRNYLNGLLTIYFTKKFDPIDCTSYSEISATA